MDTATSGHCPTDQCLNGGKASFVPGCPNLFLIQARNTWKNTSEHSTNASYRDRYDSPTQRCCPPPVSLGFFTCQGGSLQSYGTPRRVTN